MTPTQKKKLAIVVGIVLVVVAITALVMNALNSNIALFISPTDVVAGKAPKDKAFRIGGMVKAGSLKREADGVTLRFIVTDTDQDLTVFFKGILPDLFQEGKGVVAQGRLTAEGQFAATEVLAKHDENYMPPEAAQAVSNAHARAAEKKAAGQTATSAPAAPNAKNPPSRPSN